ncbi:ABC transporter permease [Acetobacteraceae bacterium H6797]|nr:ABC transporter permease [Acetobacteraceae bacterium H6797]
MPGDPIELAIIGDPRLGPEDAARLRALYELDRPLLARWTSWALGVLTGNFGHSRLFARPAIQVLMPALWSSLILVGTSLLLAILLGVAAGALAAARPVYAGAVQTVALMGQAMPSFWLGMMAIILFAVTLGWLPAGGLPDEQGLVPALRYLVLPLATLAFSHLAAYARHSAAAFRDTLREPWITSARARGASENRLLWAHALPNASVPLLTLAAIDAGALVGGALVTETLFARPGMGKLLYDSIMGNDYNLALLALMLVAAVTMLATLAADLLQLWIDPRLSASVG